MAAYKKSPFKQVMDTHGGKEQLVDKIVDVVEHGDEDKDAFKKRLQTSSNTKLLRLLARATELKDQFGSKEKLVDAILATMKRQKDADFRKKLLGFSPARLLDLHHSKARAAKAAAKKA
ncbi:MAG TPA: hypothetical protein VGQ83_25685 [Polyangia bacterium]|jgi:hypothetical protein